MTQEKVVRTSKENHTVEFVWLCTGFNCSEIYLYDAGRCVECHHELKKWPAWRRTPETPVGGIACVHCNGKGTKLQVFDAELFDGWSPEGEPCETCNGAGRITTVEQYLKTLPADWHQDSSVQTWFPILNEEVERLRRAEKNCMEHHVTAAKASEGEHERLKEFAKAHDDPDLYNELNGAV